MSNVCVAVVNIFHPLQDIGHMMLDNFTAWGNKRKEEIKASHDDEAKKVEECSKLDDRMNKFKDKMAYLNKIQPIRKHSAGSIISQTTNRKSDR